MRSTKVGRLVGGAEGGVTKSMLSTPLVDLRPKRTLSAPLALFRLFRSSLCKTNGHLRKVDGALACIRYIHRAYTAFRTYVLSSRRSEGLGGGSYRYVRCWAAELVEASTRPTRDLRLRVVGHTAQPRPVRKHRLWRDAPTQDVRLLVVRRRAGGLPNS